MTNQEELTNQQRHRNRKRSEAQTATGPCTCGETKADHCRICHQDKPTEFAHVFPTGVSGRSRGSLERYRDVIANPESYLLACQGCHYELDNGERGDLEASSVHGRTDGGAGEGQPAFG